MANVNLTGAQAWAAVQALDSYLGAGTYDECLTVFGSPKAIDAAVRARDALRDAAQPYLKARVRLASSPPTPGR